MSKRLAIISLAAAITISGVTSANASSTQSVERGHGTGSYLAYLQTVGSTWSGNSTDTYDSLASIYKITRAQALAKYGPFDAYQNYYRAKVRASLGASLLRESTVTNAVNSPTLVFVLSKPLTAAQRKTLNSTSVEWETIVDPTVISEQDMTKISQKLQDAIRVSQVPGFYGTFLTYNNADGDVTSNDINVWLWDVGTFGTPSLIDSERLKYVIASNVPSGVNVNVTIWGLEAADGVKTEFVVKSSGYVSQSGISEKTIQKKLKGKGAQ